MNHVVKRSFGALVTLYVLVTLLAGCTQATTPSPPPGPDYTMAVSPATLSAGLADSAVTSLSLTSQNGFGGVLTLSLLGSTGYPPPGMSLNRDSVTLTSGQTTTVPLEVTAAASEPVGTYDLTLRASGGGVTHTSPFNLVLSSSANGTFQGVGTYASGSTPFSIAAGDFNGDGQLDLAIANETNPGTVSVLLGNGDGTFDAAIGSPYAVGVYPYSVVVGDFNGDGKLDIAVANDASSTVSILLGWGDGTFHSAIAVPAGASPYKLAVGDFNGDGKPDLAVGHNSGSGGTVSVLLGNGDGTFAAANGSPYTVGGHPNSVAVGDFNGDGKLDLAVADAPTNDVAVLLGRGDGTFQSAVGYPAGNTPYSVAVGDFNGDGKADLAVSDAGSSTVSVLLGNGDGTFKTPQTFTVGSSPFSVAVGDFNADGNLDLAITNYSVGSVSVLLGNGDGTFQSAVSYGTGPQPAKVVVEDFNGDGKLDLAVANACFNCISGNTVSVLLGQ